jgi:AcrR family transcriptional regulator
METEPLRADAARNRQALLSAARTVMSEQGLDAPLDEIARRAGVGNATLYRRFPTRTELIVAVCEDRMAEHVHAVEEALAEPDSWEALRHYITAAGALQARDRAIADLVTLDVSSAPDIGRLRVRAVRGVETLIKRAKAAGTLRADCTAEDVLILLQSNAGLIERTNGAAASASQRLVHLLLDGLRADAATDGPLPPSPRRMRAAMRKRSHDFGFEVPARDA